MYVIQVRPKQKKQKQKKQNKKKEMKELKTVYSFILLTMSVRPVWRISRITHSFFTPPQTILP